MHLRGRGPQQEEQVNNATFGNPLRLGALSALVHIYPHLCSIQPASTQLNLEMAVNCYAQLGTASLHVCLLDALHSAQTKRTTEHSG